ncbi:SDR family NAD(P)-dependent oxidoreductase [Larkinella sp. VNQ87]|uniref:SDR family NAD(P)-dependent oxidoreductase n=1 Tax=Larkinella sp. VNQ87 TaxID=3400921 RepID=UPI003C0739FC
MNVTLITGASGGIGEAFARRLAAEKHNLLLVARSEPKLRTICGELTQQFGIQAQYVAVDLTKPGADQLLFDETEKRNLTVDGLINNAGIGSGGDLLELDLASELAMMQLNMNALVALTYRFLPGMRARKHGTIINVASMACFQPIPYMAVYAASKMFVRSFTEAMMVENQPFQIRVMLLCPGATETGFFDAANLTGEKRSAYSGGDRTETPEQVVESAMRGLRAGKRITVSGFQNRVTAFLGHFIPNSFIMPILAGWLRPKAKDQGGVATRSI